jgi:ATPase subunit of ABC transporter with duplicated ATPase domains
VVEKGTRVALNDSAALDRDLSFREYVLGGRPAGDRASDGLEEVMVADTAPRRSPPTHGPRPGWSTRADTGGATTGAAARARASATRTSTGSLDVLRGDHARPLARALARPRPILLDEPTNHLDVRA